MGFISKVLQILLTEFQFLAAQGLVPELSSVSRNWKETSRDNSFGLLRRLAGAENQRHEVTNELYREE